MALLSGAAAFVVAPAVTVEAAPQIPERTGYPGDTDLAVRCLRCDWVGSWSNGPTTMTMVWESSAEFTQHHADAHAGLEVDRDTVWRPHQAITDDDLRAARADAYERGRAIEQAKAESRAMLERPCREVEAPAFTFTSGESLLAGPVTELQIATGGASKLNLNFLKDDGGFWQTPMGKRLHEAQG